MEVSSRSTRLVVVTDTCLQIHVACFPWALCSLLGLEGRAYLHTEVLSPVRGLPCVSEGRAYHGAWTEFGPRGEQHGMLSTMARVIPVHTCCLPVNTVVPIGEANTNS